MEVRNRKGAHRGRLVSPAAVLGASADISRVVRGALAMRFQRSLGCAASEFTRRGEAGQIRMSRSSTETARAWRVTFRTRTRRLRRECNSSVLKSTHPPPALESTLKELHDG